MPPDRVPPDRVLADRVLIEQVLLNLTRNAIESMEDIAPQQRILQITASRDGGDGGVRIAVIDHGHGIAAPIAERLFSPFFSTKAEGMGMGLNICRTAIEFHGGQLVYSENPGGGTIFEFALPPVAAVAAVVAGTSAAAASEAGKRAIVAAPAPAPAVSGTNRPT